MITKTERFIKGHWGKITLYSLMVAILYLGYGCMSYQQVSMDKSDFMADKRIQTSLSGYNFYVHDGDNTFGMEDVQIVAGRDLTGKLVPVTYEDPKSDWKRLERKQWWKNHRYDIHIYTNGGLNATASASNIPALLNNERVTLSDDNIQEIKVMAYGRTDDGRGYVDAVIAVTLVVGIIVALTLLLIHWDNVDNDNGGSGSGGGSGSDGDID